MKTTKPVESKAKELQRPAAELLYAEELAKLIERDRKAVKPPGWRLSPRAVVDFVIGDPAQGLQPKFVGSRSFIECCIVALATNRGLMLIGEPGTAKSYLSELLCAAICGDSTLTIQGSAGTTEDQIKYSWNYALLLSEGPSEQALVPAPLHRGMQEGKIVRFEELTRCPLEIQDTLLSVLSERVLHIPELKEGSATLYARNGFNVLATANIRDRGVNEMSAALKRRFNFETVQPLANLQDEMALVQRETSRLLLQAGVPLTLPPDKTEVLVTVFHELRQSKTIDGKALEGLTTVMSIAEAVSVGFASALHAYYYNDGQVLSAHLVKNMVGSAIKDSGEDLKRLRHYFNHVAGGRKGEAWRDFHEARRYLDEL